MKHYRLKQEFAITDGEGIVIKDCSMQVYLNEDGIEKKHVLDMFNTIACGYVRFLGEETGAYDNMGDWDMPEEMSGETERKGWFA
jgi:hypothetical protein